jgi:hypothetical protein
MCVCAPPDLSLTRFIFLLFVSLLLVCVWSSVCLWPHVSLDSVVPSVLLLRGVPLRFYAGVFSSPVGRVRQCSIASGNAPRPAPIVNLGGYAVAHSVLVIPPARPACRPGHFAVAAVLAPWPNSEYCTQLETSILALFVYIVHVVAFCQCLNMCRVHEQSSHTICIVNPP